MNNLHENPIKFLLADDHSIVRQGMQLIIEELTENPEILHASTLQQVLQYVEKNPVQILILDAQFPDGNSISIIPEIKKLQPEITILVFTSFEEDTYSLKFINAGVDGFLSKLSEETETRIAVQEIIEKGRYFPPFTEKLLKLSARNPHLLNPLDKLSQRELEIAELYAKGYGNLEIANKLDIKQNTVSTLKKRIFEKLEVETMVDFIDFIKTHRDFH